MAVIQTPQGRVIGLIIPKDEKPVTPPKAVEKEPAPEPVKQTKRPGRPAKK